MNNFFLEYETLSSVILSIDSKLLWYHKLLDIINLSNIPSERKFSSIQVILFLESDLFYERERFLSVLTSLVIDIPSYHPLYPNTWSHDSS